MTKDVMKRETAVRWTSYDFGCVSYRRGFARQLKKMTKRAARHNAKVKLDKLI